MATQQNAPVPEVLAAEMAADRALRREERQSLTAIPAAGIDAGAQRQTFMPQNMGELIQFADLMAGCNFVPAHLRGKKGDCMAVLMQSMRWGMDPFAVANKTYFVKDGAPAAYEAQLVNAVVNSSGALSGRLRVSFEGEGDKLRCTVVGFLRADPSDAKVRTQHIARITTRNSPLWKNDPEQQLAYYTTRAWARLYTPEVLLGVYTPDEMEVDPERARVISPPRPTRDTDYSGYLAEGEGDGTPAATIIADPDERESPSQRPVEEEPVWQSLVNNTLAGIGRAKNPSYLAAVMKDFEPHAEHLPPEVVAKVNAAADEKAASF